MLMASFWVSDDTTFGGDDLHSGYVIGHGLAAGQRRLIGVLE